VLPRALLSVGLAALPLLAALWIWRRSRRVARLSGRTAFVVCALGTVAALIAVYLERIVLSATGLSFAASDSGQSGALLATFLLAAPLEEGLKVLVVWPMYRARDIRSPVSGVAYATLAAAGFAAGEAASSWLLAAPGALFFVRALAGIPAHLFCAGVWGYALGAGGSMRGRWFSFAWVFAVLLHALYDHIVWGRGPALLVLTLPLLIAGSILAWATLKDLGTVKSHDAFPASLRRVEPPSLAVMRQALRRSDRPLLLHWIVIGALVTLGIMLVLLSGAVYLGHEVGIDFAIADEADVRSSAPIVLLGTAVLVAFPLSGYLVARASSATSVLEPAMGAGLALVAVVLGLSITAPIAVVFVLAVAPIAFGLACGGAWLGIEH
jgi:RsiW-degrading membrane proteinase PrsW (M82 family)